MPSKKTLRKEMYGELRNFGDNIRWLREHYQISEEVARILDVSVKVMKVAERGEMTKEMNVEAIFSPVDRFRVKAEHLFVLRFEELPDDAPAEYLDGRSKPAVRRFPRRSGAAAAGLMEATETESCRGRDGQMRMTLFEMRHFG